MVRPDPRIQASMNNFTVEVLEYEDKLNPKEFLDWLDMVERVFEHKDVLGDKKVTLVALKLRK